MCLVVFSSTHEYKHHLVILVSKPLPFFPSVCKIRKWKSSDKWGRPGNTYHVNDVMWMLGGRREGRPVPNYKQSFIQGVGVRSVRHRLRF